MTVAKLPASLYIHVPFCRHRCGYCDFTLVAGRDDLIPRFLAALERDIGQPQHETLKTLYLGGGTPSQLAAAQFDELLRLLGHAFEWTTETEVTVEANPLDLTRSDLLASLVRGGVNRISLGVQSFDAAVLRTLERDHTPEMIDEVLATLVPVIPNISLDLIFGVPGQSLETWQGSLRRAIDLGARHISTYGLTFETGSAFETRRRRGEIVPVENELEREMYAVAIEQLTAAGYEQYEISNFAQPGFRSQHNQVYWVGAPYLAFGPGASSFIDGTRNTNARTVLGWLAKIERGESPVAESETLTGEHRAREFIYLALRRVIDGLSRRTLREQTGCELDDIAGDAVKANIVRGWLEDDGERIRLTRAGCFFADQVAADFL